MSKSRGARHVILVLGDQLDPEASCFEGFDADRDVVCMAEVDAEATHVPCHKSRLVMFFSAMRHFRDALADRGIHVDYHELSPKGAEHDRITDFAGLLQHAVETHEPERVILTWPGDYRVLEQLETAADEIDVPLDVREDTHFYVSLEDFNTWAEGRKSLTLEYFYREIRKREDVLMSEDDDPVGGQWNFDKDNRESFGRDGPGDVPTPIGFEPDAITRDVIDLVERRFADHPGEVDAFDMPVTAEQAEEFLDDFITHRLPNFGTYEDAIWSDEPILYHSRLSAPLNLKLLNPRRCVAAAVRAYQDGDAPINSVEGFVRQVLGWREFIRGVYWRHMPEYIEMNALDCDADRDVPQAFWDGQTQMNCVATAMRSVVRLGYAHHIPRLMVLGLYAMLLGVHPRRFHDWHMAMYLDAVDWVSLPNTLGMSQFGDGGVVGTKPYSASGNYIDRMSNCCKGCRYNPKHATGDDACPMTTLYWDFLDRHKERFESNTRMKMQYKNLERKSDQEMDEIRQRAAALRAEA